MQSLTAPVGRQRFVSLAVAAIAAITITSSASAQERVFARTTSPLNVRSGPGTEYRLLGTLPEDTRVEVRSRLGTWSQVAYGTGAAWLPTAFLAPLTDGGSSDTIQVNVGAGTIQANVGGLQLRVSLSTLLPTVGASPTPTPGPAIAPNGPTLTTPAPAVTGATITGATITGPTATAPTAPTPVLSGSLANGIRTQTPQTSSAATGSTGARPTGAGAGTTSIGAPEQPAPQQTTPQPAQTGTAPGAPASSAALPTSSAYAPSGSVPPGQSAGYIQLRATGAGHYGYGSAARKYGRPALIYGLERISAAFASTGHKMGVGDISQNGGGTISGHASHKLGVDVDVRPCRKDKLQQPVTWQQTALYDRAATQTLGNLFGRELRLTNFFFNDAQISVRTKTPWPNHDNHFHARINPN